MTCFLTSSPCLEDGSLNPANGFVDGLRAALTQPFSCLFLCSDPDSPDGTDAYAGAMSTALLSAGLPLMSLEVLDGRNRRLAAPLVRGAGLLILAGGHVPTQNAFFRDIGLRELLAGYDGVILGVSAGTMNSAELVYAQPELEGEAVSPSYRRFLPGLGLTKTMVIPHYQVIRHDVLDGLRVFEDITYPDSVGRRFYALVDGSYLLLREGAETLCGEAYLIEDGRLSPVSQTGDRVRLV